MSTFDMDQAGDGDFEGQSRHTQFLDLTNGEGGEKKTTRFEDEEHNGASRSVGPPSIMSTQPSMTSRIDPNTPGKVVESGLEHTGRWTREEHDAFLSALQMYGKEWKKVAAKVKTRTVVQTRTHAQKYFQKLQKTASENKGVMQHVEMGVASETKKSSSQKKKSKQLPTMASKSRAQSQSTTAAAQLMAHLSNTLPAQNDFSPAPPYAAGAPPPPTHGFSSGDHSNREATFNGNSSSSTNGNGSSASSVSFFSSAAAVNNEGWGTKIIAPDPESAMRRGFPEPSPAACGKRKLAEIAAARMLAGVAAAGDRKTPPPVMPQVPNLGGPAAALQIVNPESLGVTYNEMKRKMGDPSPTTPWDDQLEALVTETKRKEVLEGSHKSEESIILDSLQLPGHQILPVCGPGHIYNRSPLHKAVCDLDVVAIHKELSDSIGATALHRKDDGGFFPIHSAAALGLLDEKNAVPSMEITNLLISSGSETSTCDVRLNTPLHWAARAGNVGIAKTLLMKNCPLDAQNEDGDTALHWAMKAGRKGMGVVHVLVENGARPSIFNNEFKRALDVAGEGFSDNSNAQPKKATKSARISRTEQRKRKAERLEEKMETRANLLSLSMQSRTLVLHHPECLEHIPKSDSDWEVPDRITSILTRILPKSDENSGVFPYEITVSSEFERARLEFLSRVHSADYLSFVSDLSKELSRNTKEFGEGEDCEDAKNAPQVVPFTPMVQKKILTLAEPALKKGDHSDTSFSAGSLRAARRAAGSVQHAVDCVLIGRHRNAFCVVRPPGHHAGIKGLLAGGESCGFCIFNNVAAGAMHAISDERLMCKRCAIVDIDVHHGNGTEEIVKRCHDPGKLFFFSIHLYDNEKRKQGYSFYPGTGEEDDVAHNIINVPLAPLWRESFAQERNSPVPLNTHNTRHKARQSAASGDDQSQESEGVKTDGPRASDTDSETSSFKGSKAAPLRSRPSSPRYSQFGRKAYRKAIQNRLLPALRAFNPDLILISAGFDAAKGDVGNARHYAGGKEKIGLDLEPEDYAWTTRKIVEIADICCQGRVVSVLEGGYGRSALTPIDPDNMPRLDKSYFSDCAIRHLHALIDPYDAEMRFG